MIDIGKNLSGRYKIIGNIGRGGMANVYLAHDLILDRDVAVKVLRFDFQEDQSAIRRFQREALAATELVHPNIVSVYDVGEENGMQYLVMEYVKGTDLKKYIANNFPIAYGEIVKIMEQILSAISLAHQHRIIHRDLKPQNVLVDQNGDVKITDFGIAIALSETSITQTNTMLGSVHYLSPEQARGSMATRQSDIYAMGIVLFELLTGHVPFEGESAVSIALKHFQNEMPSVREANPEIPQALENVVLHATAKEASDRYSSADEMLRDISTCLSPERLYEPRYTPTSMTDETIVLTSVTESLSDMPEAFKEMPVPDEELELSLEEEPLKKPKNNKKKILIGLGIVIGFIVLGATFLAMTSPKTVTMPDVSGKTVSEATDELNALKLKVKTEVEEIPNSDIKKGDVVKTNPEAKTNVKEKSEVTLFVSSGGKKISIRDYKNMTLSEAKKDLISKGFTDKQIQVEEVADDTVDEGKIVSQTPSKGTEVDPKEDTITLEVSKGAEQFTLRSMYLLSKADVQAYLEEKGLNLIEDYTSSETVGVGLALSQTPGSGTKVQRGDYVTVTFSTGPAPVQPSTPPSSSETSSTSSEQTNEVVDPNKPDPNKPDPNKPDPNKPDPNKPDPNKPDPNEKDPKTHGDGKEDDKS